ncbi:MAG: arylesterase [Sphingobacteriales bacterium]|nr:MAG: arylesterase [Sphingobacteriales bacterium]
MRKLDIIKPLILSVLLSACSTGEDQPKQKSEAPPAVAGQSKKTILFFGDSLTAGYGLEDPSTAFPSLIQDKLDAMKMDYKVVNAGVSGETSAGGNARVDWILKQPIDVFVLELGANDGLRGVPVAETRKNLQEIVDKVKAKYPSAKLMLAGMMVPPNMGSTYATAFQEVFPQIAKTNNMAFMPFLLKDVGGMRELNQGDGIHPTEKGHKIIAENLWPVLKPIL